MIRICAVLVMGTLFTSPSVAESVYTDPEDGAYILSGRLVDTQTGEPLPAANIQIKDTFRGSITNNQGFFELGVSELPVTLVFRYIGYETQEIDFTEDTRDQLVALQPASIELEELVFTGQDPALHIMERVILRKQIWRKELESWKADAYTRTSLSNAEEIVTINESLSQTWWQKGKGFREYIVDQRQTSNVLANQNFAGTSYLPNFYDDEIEIAGFRIIGVTHPDAFRYYDFKIKDRRYLDDQIVYDIRVIPKSRLQPVFEGMVSVLGGEYALLEVDLVPGEMVFFPPPVQEVNLSYRQQFSNYGGDFWLPTDVRISGMFNIGLPGFKIPEIRFNLVSSITNYEVNTSVPDSVFGAPARFKRLNDIERARLGRSFELQNESIPLSEEERTAYETIDSTKSVQEAFQPTGALARLAGNGGMQFGSGDGSFGNRFSLGPEFRFNRVDAFYGGISPTFKLTEGITLGSKVAYSTGREDLSYGGSITYRGLAARRNGRVRLLYDYDSYERIQSVNFSPFLSSINTLVGYDDYFDYYQRERLELSFSYRFREPVANIWLRPEVHIYTENQRSLAQTSSYSLRGDILQRPNPAIDEGRLNALGFTLQAGGAPAPFGIAGGNSMLLNIEHSSPALLESDFDYTRYEARLDLRIDTFLKRRFLANALDIRLQGFTHSGELPLQRMGGFDGRHSLFSPFGGFKTAYNRMPEGEHGVAVFWEHNFRTVPFELLGMRRAAKSGLGLIVHGGSGRSWIGEERLDTLEFLPFYEDNWRHEIGVSLNSIFGLMRLDASWRLDQPGFYLGISAARIF